MPTFSTWVRSKFGLEGKGGKKNHGLVPPLPFLPAIRPRVLTPSPSTVSLAQSAPPPPATTELSFFDQFPFEIRRKILIEAFGDQVVHMHLTRDGLDLEWDMRRAPMPKDPTLSPHERAPGPTQLKSKKSKSKQDRWYWTGSVCHRASPTSMRGYYGEKLSDCMCLGGRGSDFDFCQFWPGKLPGKCYIGAMGWLLVSRQAYAEGVDVLYSTNTIHMAQKPMILHLPRLLLPQRLDAINSVEMRWYTYPFISISGFDDFQFLLAATLSSFAHLKKLRISLEGNWRRTNSIAISNTEINGTILGPVEAMIRKMPNIQRFQVDLPLSLYDEKRAKVNQEYVRNGYFFRKERIWRNLSIMVGEGPHLEGYWISLGHMDRSVQYNHDDMPSCFGCLPPRSESPPLSMKDVV